MAVLTFEVAAILFVVFYTSSSYGDVDCSNLISLVHCADDRSSAKVTLNDSSPFAVNSYSSRDHKAPARVRPDWDPPRPVECCSTTILNANESAFNLNFANCRANNASMPDGFTLVIRMLIENPTTEAMCPFAISCTYHTEASSTIGPSTTGSSTTVPTTTVQPTSQPSTSTTSDQTTTVASSSKPPTTSPYTSGPESTTAATKSTTRTSSTNIADTTTVPLTISTTTTKATTSPTTKTTTTTTPTTTSTTTTKATTTTTPTTTTSTVTLVPCGETLSYKYCSGLSDKGFCKTNPLYMREHCGVTCRMCAGTLPTTGPTTPSTTSPSTRQPELPDCSSKTCTELPGKYNCQSCYTTCNGFPCKDSENIGSAKCRALKAALGCDTIRSYCANTCGICEKLSC